MPTKVEKNDVAYVKNAAKLCQYFVDIEGLFIEIPEGSEPDMMSLHLKNTRGFQIRYMIPGSERVKEEPAFNPSFSSGKSVRTPEGKKEIQPQYKAGETFKTRGIEIYQIAGKKANGDLIIRVVNSMTPDFDIQLLTAQINVKHKLWILQP